MEEKFDLDRKKLELEISKLEFEQKKWNEERKNRVAATTNQYAIEAQKAVLIINGAAAIALITFASNILRTSGSAVQLGDLINGASTFGAGVALASVSSTSAYFFRVLRPRCIAKYVYVLSALTGIAALGMFPLGVYFALSSISVQTITPTP